MTIDLHLISSSLSYGDWMLCYHLMQNMDCLTFAEWLQELTKLLKNAEDEKKIPGTQENIPLMTSMVALLT